MSDTYTPSLDEMIECVCGEGAQGYEREEFDRFIEQVRADAKREALTKAANELEAESPFHNYDMTEAHWQVGAWWAKKFRARAEAIQ